MGCKIPPEILNYLKIIEKSKAIVCKEQKQLAALVRRVFREEEIYVDTKRLETYLSFQKFFPFELFPWEIFLFTLHNCTYEKKTGLPRFPDLFMLVGRGAGKNGFLSFEDFCLLTSTHGVKGYNIDICATSEDQAKTSFDEIRETVLEDDTNKELLSKSFKWTKEEILNLNTMSRLRYRTSNARTKDGLRTGKVDFDEYHEYELQLYQANKNKLNKTKNP